MSGTREYTAEFKEQAIKLAKEVGNKRAADELGIPKNTLGTWVYKVKKGEIEPGAGNQTPETALTLVAENQELCRQLKAQEKEIKRLNELNDFLEDAAAFFAAMYCIESSEVGKRERLKFIAIKTEDGIVKRKISFYCRALSVSRQAFYDYLFGILKICRRI